MTSESDSTTTTSRRRPPTIDLTATEIETDRPASPADRAESPEGSAKQAEPRQRAGWEFVPGLRRHVVGAAVGAIVTAVILLGIWLVAVVPSQNSATKGISAQLDKIQAELQAPRPPPPAPEPRLAALEAQTKALGDSVAALTRRVDDVAVAGRGSVQRSDIDALANRIAALESNIKAVSENLARRPLSADDHAARAAVAAEALRAVVERGAPYQAELAEVKLLGADQNAVASLEPFAAAGVPSAAELARELSLLTPALRKASGAASSGGSLVQRLERSAKSLVQITPIDAPPSDEPSAVVARLDADAERADIAAALADIGRLPASAKTLAEPWLEKANARDAAIAASRRIAADALAGLNNANTQ
jgi:hypothetical protein